MPRQYRTWCSPASGLCLATHPVKPGKTKFIQKTHPIMKFFATTNRGKNTKHLKAICLQMSPDELRQVASFLEDCAKRMESSRTFGHAHIQDLGCEVLRNAIKQGVEPDIVVVQPDLHLSRNLRLEPCA
jgi:hypothetical protein